MNKRILAIISTKKKDNQDNNIFIANCVNKLNELYDLDIIIISSDEQEYDMLKGINKTDNITVKFVHNKHYEIGAWKLGYDFCPNYDIYLCIQDSLIPTNKFDFCNFSKNNIALFQRTAYWDSIIERKEALNLVKDSKYYDLVNNSIMKESTIYNYYKSLNLSPNIMKRVCPYSNLCYRINLCQHCSFIIHNDNLKDLLINLIKLPKEKMHSCAYERILGIIFHENLYSKAEQEIMKIPKQFDISIDGFFQEILVLPKYNIIYLNNNFKKISGNRM